MTAALTLTDDERDRLRRVADVLMPPSAGLPAAGAVDTTGRWLDRVLAADPSMLEPLRLLAAMIGADPWRDAETFARRDPEVFERAADALVAAYSLHPAVRKPLGYPGQGGDGPVGDDDAAFYLPDALLDPVRARGPRYLPTPDA